MIHWVNDIATKLPRASHCLIIMQFSTVLIKLVFVY